LPNIGGFLLDCLMPNTYTQLYVQFVFAVKYRRAMLLTPWDEELRRYITGITQQNGHKMLAINTMPDHLHMLVGLNSAQSISDLMRVVKGDSSEWINKHRLTPDKFQWQEGYGAFSYAKSQLQRVVAYVQNQQLHHRKKSFLEEYRHMLVARKIDFDERYIFHEPKDH
jgi:putative transposase